MNDKKNKVALKAGIWYVISSVMVKTIAVTTTPIFTRLMSTSEYGVTATFTSWYSLLITIATLNLTYSIGRAKIDFPNELDCYLGSMQLLSSIVAGIMMIVAIVFNDHFSNILELNNSLVILLAVYLFFSPTISFFQNSYRYKYKYKQNIAIAWYSALSTVFLSLILILTVHADKALLRCIGIVIPSIILSCYFWIKSWKNGYLSINIIHWKYGLKLSVPLILHTISLNILAQSDRIFIAKMCNVSDVGIYSLVYSYGILISVITNAIADGWLPWFHDNYYSGNFEEIRKNLKPIITLGCFLTLGCIAFGPEAVLILGGHQYTEGIYCIPPIVLGILCQYIYTHYVNIELHLKKTKFVSIGTVLAAVFNIITNIVFIPIYGFIAASYTTLASYLLLMTVHFFITREVLSVKLYNDLFMFGSMIGTAIISALIIFTYDHTIIRYILIVLGLIICIFYFRVYITNWLTKLNNLNIFNKLCKK